MKKILVLICALFISMSSFAEKKEIIINFANNQKQQKLYDDSIIGQENYKKYKEYFQKINERYEEFLSFKKDIKNNRYDEDILFKKIKEMNEGMSEYDMFLKTLDGYFIWENYKKTIKIIEDISNIKNEIENFILKKYKNYKTVIAYIKRQENKEKGKLLKNAIKEINVIRQKYSLPTNLKYVDEQYHSRIEW